jgi:hypothetical protein
VHGVEASVSAGQLTARVDDPSLDGCSTGVIRLWDVRATVAYREAPGEADRRRLAGQPAILHRAVLEALMGLPVGMPVPSDALSPADQHLIRQAPRGAVDEQDGRFVRRAVAPVSVRLALVEAGSWQQGVSDACRFAPFSSRAAVLPAVPADVDTACAQAEFYGVGLYVRSGTSVRELLAPEVYVRRRHTSAQWRFAEDVYRQLTAPVPDTDAPTALLSTIPAARR